MVGDVTPRLNASADNIFIYFYLENMHSATHRLSYAFPLLFVSVIVFKWSCQVVAAMGRGYRAFFDS